MQESLTESIVNYSFLNEIGIIDLDSKILDWIKLQPYADLCICETILLKLLLISVVIGKVFFKCKFSVRKSFTNSVALKDPRGA